MLLLCEQYRCPEVITGMGYDTSSDIWSVACVLFEAATGDVLFNPRSGATWSRDDDHLAMFIELLGPMPKKYDHGLPRTDVGAAG